MTLLRHRRHRRLRRPRRWPPPRPSRPSWSARSGRRPPSGPRAWSGCASGTRRALQRAEDAAEERAVDDLVTGRAGRPATRRPRRCRGRSDAVQSPDQPRSSPASCSTADDRDAPATGPRAAAAAGLTGTGAADVRQPDRRTASESAVVAEAQKYLGVPYVWGGTDPAKGLDCSGFTQLVYGNLGIDLPRTPRSRPPPAGRSPRSPTPAPATWCSSTTPRRAPGVDHVGIYVGNGKMIAAPQEGESVKVQDVGTPDASSAGSCPSRRRRPRRPAGGAALAGVPYADLFTRAAQPLRRRPLACWPRWPARSPASTPRRSPPPAPRA